MNTLLVTFSIQLKIRLIFFCFRFHNLKHSYIFMIILQLTTARRLHSNQFNL